LASSEPLLEVVGVSVDYGRMRALSDVSYRIEPGQVVCLLGGNASGKSTSMKAIFGTVPLAAGQVRWKGKRIDHLPTWKRVRFGLSTVPEGRRVFARMTVEENLRVGALDRRDRAGITADIEHMNDMFPALGKLRHRLAGTLSGGEQQMLAVGRALMSRPSIVCMDEPSMGLSPKLVRTSFALISAIKADGTAVFVVEQNARAALSVADYAYVLQTGRLILEGTSEEVATSELMREAYLGKTRALETSPNAPEGGLPLISNADEPIDISSIDWSDQDGEEASRTDA
jgi:branched-chain amino acid transport system ATP-binding protein